MRLIFISHPEVIVDPTTPIPDWGLSPHGTARATAFARSPELHGVTAIWSSTERKAQETAQILAKPLGLNVQTRTDLGENDRSATGFLPPEVFEAAADAFFAAPDVSFQGWETATEAQTRITQAVTQIVAQIVAWHQAGDLAIVSHGAVGTLLLCHLRGLLIDRQHDQPGQGHYWVADLPTLTVQHGWRAI